MPPSPPKKINAKKNKEGFSINASIKFEVLESLWVLGYFEFNTAKYCWTKLKYQKISITLNF